MTRFKNLIISVESKTEDIQFVYSKIVEYNIKQVEPTQELSFETIFLALRDNKGNLLGGLIANLFMWNFMNIDVLWVEDSLRKSGYGKKLLQELEMVADQKKCKLIQVDTFSFQAPEFYKKNGYEVFGILEDCPSKGHQRYYLKKVLP